MLTSVEKNFQSYYSVVFSPCGAYLAFSDRCGTILVHKLSNLLRSGNTSSDAVSETVTKLRPLVIISDSNSSTDVHLLAWRDFLLCCFSNGQVDAYRWSDLAKQRTTAAWSKRLCDPKRQGSLTGCEFATWRTLTDHSGRDLLLGGSAASGSDQNNCPIVSWDFESAKLNNTYHGHTNSIYTISPCCKADSDHASEFLSSGEDGDVRLWDLRASTVSMAVLKPAVTECARPGFGRWIGCLASDGEWMVCGGGPQLGLWNVSARALVKPMTTNGTDLSEHYCGIIIDDRIITGGGGGNILHWNYRGDSMAVMPASPNFVYDLAYTASSGQQMLAAVGTGSLIELYSHLIYRMTPLENLF